MIQPRRGFLRILGAATSCVICTAVAAAQGRHKFPDPPPPAEQGDPNGPPFTNPQITQRAPLNQNEKEFRQSLDSLFERVSELKQDTDAMHTAEIFSVKVYKQTGEIEHLAKKLRNLAKS